MDCVYGEVCWRFVMLCLIYLMMERVGKMRGFYRVWQREGSGM